ncbi:MAG: YHS domain-containing protein [Deltaproteobacteria bacterium]|nr:YHS domain-containing protein [Deltaproteobacteria bacterium]
MSVIRYIILAFLGYLLYRTIKGVFRSNKEIDRSVDGGVIDEMVQDPFCKTYIPRRESVKKVIDGNEYRFCSDECASKFESMNKSA